MLSVAVSVAKKAGNLLKKSFRRAHTVSYKDAHNVVSESDVQAEKIIMAGIKKKFPTHDIFSEEAGMDAQGSDFLWIVDPLDGTTNFTRAVPHFCVSIALAKKGQVVLAVVYNPITGEIFTAEKGKGAFLNGKKISASGLDDISKAVVLVNRGASKEEKVRYTKIFDLLYKHVRSIRVYGSTALDLCYTAAGRFEAVIDNGCEFYDCAAGNLIAMEAGAMVTDFKGSRWAVKKSDILVCSPLLHPQFVGILKEQ